MPWKPDVPCRVPGCPGLGSGGYCARHKAERAESRAEKDRRYNAKRPSASAQGYGSRWRRLRLMVLREVPWCEDCGAVATEVDHVLALKKGGTNERTNLRSLCLSCHSRKTAREDR